MPGGTRRLPVVPDRFSFADRFRRTQGVSLLERRPGRFLRPYSAGAWNQCRLSPFEIPGCDVLMRQLTRQCLFVCVVGVAFAGRAAAQTPAAPAPLQPANGASVQVPLTISWSETLNPSEISGGYNWQVSRSSTFAPLVLADSTSPATTQDVVSGLTAGRISGACRRSMLEARAHGPRPEASR
jgi:hypothetical protein